MYRLRVKESFAASHILPDHNGPCSKLHGHTWKVAIEVSAKNVGNGGMVVDFADLKRELRRVVAIFDHSHLNDLKWFQVVPPTAENVAAVFRGEINFVGLTSVTIWESDSASVTLECGE